MKESCFVIWIQPKEDVLELHNVRKFFGDRLLINDMSFTLPKASILDAVGPTGARESRH